MSFVFIINFKMLEAIYQFTSCVPLKILLETLITATGNQNPKNFQIM